MGIEKYNKKILIIKNKDMKAKINSLELLDRAKNMVLQGYNLEQSLLKSSMIELLQFQLMNGASHFLFRKKDGSIRETWGTLLEKVVVRNTNGLGYPRKCDGLQAYFDVEEQAWRSFRYENLITILN